MKQSTIDLNRNSAGERTVRLKDIQSMDLFSLYFGKKGWSLLPRRFDSPSKNIILTVPNRYRSLQFDHTKQTELPIAHRGTKCPKIPNLTQKSVPIGKIRTSCSQEGVQEKGEKESSLRSESVLPSRTRGNSYR